jgi:endonuclease/exonuclease/phosphatase family metal-dependent hydrolase
LPAGGRRRFLGEPRGALWIAVQWRGREIQIVNTHLGLGRRERLAQIGALLGPDWLGSPDCRAPRVFLGDLNSFPGGRVYRAVAALLCDAQRAVAGRPRPTYPAHLPIFRIDHVFASEDMAVESVRAWDTPLARVASDHLPLVVRLRPPSGTSRPDGIAMRAEPLRRTRTEGSG